MRIPVGPIHPALPEPEHFLFEVDGEKVLGLKYRLGHMHRGIEKLMESRTFVQGIHLAERVCGICSNVHTSSYALAVERIAKVESSERVDRIRTIVSELERLHNHLMWLGFAGDEMGHESVLMYTWRVREQVMDLLEEIGGNRVNYTTNRPGGLNRDLSEATVKRLRPVMDEIDKITDFLLKVFDGNLIRSRLENVGVLTKKDAITYGAVGPTARGSGVDYDIRKKDPYFYYPHLDFEVVVEKNGDAFSKALVRIREMPQSAKIIRQASDQIPSGELSVKINNPVGEAIGRIEAQRGEVFYYISANGTNVPERVRIKTPTYSSFPSYIPMFRDAVVADIPVIVASIDPCFACMDRVAVLENGKLSRISMRELAKK